MSESIDYNYSDPLPHSADAILFPVSLGLVLQLLGNTHTIEMY